MEFGQGNLGLLPFPLRLAHVGSRPLRECRGLALLPLSCGLGVDIESVECVGRQVAVNAPSEELSTARGKGGGQTGVWKPLHVGQYNGRVWPPALNNVDQINAVIELQVCQEPFPELVDQVAEAEASPAEVPSV